MAAELGQTNDPRALIPGEPGRISGDIDSLVGTIETVGGIGGELLGIDPGGWAGGASDAFREAFGQEPLKWDGAVDVLGKGGQALADFGDLLNWGQSEAQRAIEMYTQAEAAARTEAAQRAADAVQTGGETLAAGAEGVSAGMQEAKTVLEGARKEVASVGGVIAEQFGMTSDGKGGYTKSSGDRNLGVDNRQTQKRWDPQTKQWVDEDPGGWQDHKGGKSYSKEKGSMADGLLHTKLEGALKGLGVDLPTAEWKGEARADWLAGKTEGEFKSGDFSGKGSAEGSILGASAGAHGEVNGLSASGGANAEAHLAKGSADGELAYGEHVSGKGHVEGIVGAEASAEGNVGLTGAQGSAEAFAGAKVEGDVSGEVAGIGAGVHGEAWAGAGAQAGGQFGMGDDGKFHVGGSVGVGLGIGGKVGFDYSVDPGAMVDSASDAAGAVSGVAKDVGGGISDAASTAKDALGF